MFALREESREDILEMTFQVLTMLAGERSTVSYQ